MRRASGALLVLVLIVVGSACAANRAAGGPRSQADPITVEEIERRGPFSTLYDLVQILRPRWLRSQGPDSLIGQQGQVQVHMDGNWLGSVETLRDISAHGVTSIHWLGPVDASARYGLNHSHGAIVVSTAVIH